MSVLEQEGGKILIKIRPSAAGYVHTRSMMSSHRADSMHRRGDEDPPVIKLNTPQTNLRPTMSVHHGSYC